ncbi:ArsR/SmtB family transcription factor, partial [Kibdelosporangium lantanae]
MFQSLGRPVRIRVLELLDDGPRTVRRLIDAIRIGPSRLSQQLAVLRTAGLVVGRRVLTHLVLGQ